MIISKWLKTFQAKPVTSSDVTNVYTNTEYPINLGIRVLVFGFVGFLIWAAIAPLDEGVAAQATVSTESRRSSIQHYTGGVISSVLVKEGQWVKEGEVLVLLDGAKDRADYETIRQNYLSQRATESRLQAELKGQSVIIFHKDLIDAGKDPLIKQQMQTQKELFNSRRASYAASINGLSSMLENRKQQAEYQLKQLSSIKELSAEGFAPRNQLLQMQQNQSELQVIITDLMTNLSRVKQEYLKEVSAQLAEVRREVQSGQEKIVAYSENLARTQIKSPIDGQVVGLTISSNGGVASPGQRLMDIVPQGVALTVDAKVPPHVIDKVYVGEFVEIRFNNFANSPQLVLEGKLTSVSSDIVTEQTPMGNMSFYLARIQLTPDGINKLGKHVMQPGMPAEVLIKTGERTLLTYLLHPLTKRLASAMKEE